MIICSVTWGRGAVKFCANCGSRVVVSGALFCTECGKPVTLDNNAPRAPVEGSGSPELSASVTALPPDQSTHIWARLNDWLNSVGLWLEAKISKVFRKPLTRTRLRFWFSVSAVIAFYFLLLTLFIIEMGDEAQLLGVQVVPLIQFPFLILVVVLLVYLIVLPPNWMKVLQLLMWACLARGLFFLIWNLFALAQGIPYANSDIEVLLLIATFGVFSPLAGFLIVLPATYIWIRTRQPAALVQ